MNHGMTAREEMDLVEEGLNFVTLYNLETVDISVDEEIQECQDQHRNSEESRYNQLDEEVSKYSKWIQNTLDEYWEVSKPEVVDTEDDEFNDEFYEHQEETEYELENDAEECQQEGDETTGVEQEELIFEEVQLEDQQGGNDDTYEQLKSMIGIQNEEIQEKGLQETQEPSKKEVEKEKEVSTEQELVQDNNK